ncbi:MAG: hypothetical protein NVS3B3_19040 [Aquirhabdus sp.]
MSYKQAVRWPWLVFILAAHTVFILVWSNTLRRQPHTASLSALPTLPALIVELIRPVELPQAKPVTTAALATPQTKSPPAWRRPSMQADNAIIAAPAESDIVASTPTITVEPGLNLDTRQISKDLQSQQRALPFAVKSAIPPIARLGDKIAAAAVPGEVTYKTFTTADGSLITKVTSALGSYCVIAPNPAGGATLIQREARSNRVVSCGNY